MFIVVLLALVLAQLCTTQQQQLQQQPDPTEALKTMLKAQVCGRCSSLLQHRRPQTVQKCALSRLKPQTYTYDTAAALP
jgi:uncharacterized paraquat-inducible protein A